MVALERVLGQLRAGHEARGFEVKGPGSVDDKHLLAKVARAGLSLGNLRDGGLVVIGIDDDQLEAMTPGLSQEQLAGWTDFDRLSAGLAVYADHPLSFDTQAMELPNGATVAVIEVAEFSDVPHLCAKAFDGESSSKPVLRRGALYVRTRGKPETAEVATAEQMREVLEIAPRSGSPPTSRPHTEPESRSRRVTTPRRPARSTRPATASSERPAGHERRD